jgi:hypothetical protein
MFISSTDPAGGLIQGRRDTQQSIKSQFSDHCDDAPNQKLIGKERAATGWVSFVPDSLSTISYHNSVYRICR